jgi:toxin FitB
LKGYLLDTSVLSLLAPGRTPSPPITAWLQANGERLYVCTITITEVRQGIAKLRRTGGAARAKHLTHWLDALISSGADRIIAFDISAAFVAGDLSDRAMASGRHPGFADVAIAAVAQSRDLVLLTSNVRHFQPLSVPYRNPLEPGFLDEG